MENCYKELASVWDPGDEAVVVVVVKWAGGVKAPGMKRYGHTGWSAIPAGAPVKVASAERSRGSREPH